MTVVVLVFMSASMSNVCVKDSAFPLWIAKAMH